LPPRDREEDCGRREALANLRRWNLGVGLAHLAQALAILLLASAVSLPVTITYLIGPPGAGDFGGPKELFDLRVDIAVAAFLLLATIDHLSVGTWGRRWYQRQVSRGINPARWWEYSISASLMVVLIAMLAGVREATALVALFGANAAMILFGLTMERVNVGSERVRWRPFIYGCLIGSVPWIAIALQLAVSQNETGNVPGFVIAIFVTLLLLFNSFAVSMWLQYRRRGRWADPLSAEKAYLVLSLVAKSALAWQVYGGALAGS
jgi:Heliorhodopsin